MKNAKRYLAVALSFALFLALPLAFTQEAAAASKGTKVTQVSKVVEVTTNASGTKTEVAAYAYDKKGLNTLYAVQDGNGKITNKCVSTYNKSGYLTSDTWLDANDKPFNQSIYTVKSGKLKAVADYTVDGAKVDLQDSITYAYKNGKMSKATYASADGKFLIAATFKKGVVSQVAVSDKVRDCQEVILFDKYGNATSDTMIYKDGTVDKAVFKNTYKNGKLVKVVSATAYSGSTDVVNGLTVYTYKKGKLVKEVSAWTNSGTPGETSGYTVVYAYTEGGLIKTMSEAWSTTTASGTKVDSSRTKAYQYQKVAVDKKCVKAVKEAMEDYCYESYLPGGVNLYAFAEGNEA